MMNNVLLSIKSGLIVSCQARDGWPMHGAEVMADFAKAAEIGGAVAIRANGATDIHAIKNKVTLPIIGIKKDWQANFESYITPCWQDAKEILEEGVDIIAIDAGPRSRPNNETYYSILSRIKEKYPNVLVMAEIASFNEAMSIKDSGCDLISTTLAGYTDETRDEVSLNTDLIKKINQSTNIPVIAEGHIIDGEEAVSALIAGAYAVVVGTSITRPEVITERFAREIANYNKNK